MSNRQLNKPLLVLDTNVVLDLLHFDDAAARPLLSALEAGRVDCVVTDATLDELRRVLAYSRFALEPARQAALLGRYQGLSMMVEASTARAGLPHKGTLLRYGLTPVWSRMPRCSDPDDQKFIELAAASGAQTLVSKDRALLRLSRRCAAQFRIVTPAGALAWLAAAPAPTQSASAT